MLMMLRLSSQQTRRITSGRNIHTNLPFPDVGKQLHFSIQPDGTVYTDWTGSWNEYHAIAVPDHGGLIDVDALFDSCHIHWSQTTNESCVPVDEIDFAPIIIPADKEDDL